MPVVIPYVLVVLIWSSTPLAIQWSALETGFTFAAMSRMLLALGCAILFLIVARIPLGRSWRSIASYGCAGVGLFLAMVSVYWAASRMDSGLMSVIFGLSPLVTSILATVFLQTRVFSGFRLAGMALGMVGLTMVFMGDGTEMQSGYLAGVAGLLFGVLSNSAALVGLKWLADDSHPLATTTGALVVATPLFVMTWWMSGGVVPEEISMRGGLSIIYLGILGSVIGFAMYYIIVRKMEPTQVSLMMVVTPVMALFFGRVFNSESLPSQVWVGAIVIGAGLLLHESGRPTDRVPS